MARSHKRSTCMSSKSDASWSATCRPFQRCFTKFTRPLAFSLLQRWRLFITLLGNSTNPLTNLWSNKAKGKCSINVNYWSSLGRTQLIRRPMPTTKTATASLTTLSRRKLIPSANEWRSWANSLELTMSQMMRAAPPSAKSLRSSTASSILCILRTM